MAEDIIRLNVGGVCYSTTKQTLSKQPNSLLCRIVDGSAPLPEGILLLPSTEPSDVASYFVDRDGDLFSHILHYLRTGKLALPDGFRDLPRLRDEADFFKLDDLYELCLDSEPLKIKLSNGGASMGGGEHGGYITLGYRGTFAFGRDGQADVKFRKLHRILVCGRVTLCREVFGDSLNESRDPGGPDDGERYTSRLYLKHQCLERACDLMAEKGFKLVATCCSGANGLAAANHPVVSGSGGAPGQSDLMNHRNCGDYEEQRWAHYTEYVFYREPNGPMGASTPSPRDDYLSPR